MNRDTRKKELTRAQAELLEMRARYQDDLIRDAIGHAITLITKEKYIVIQSETIERVASQP